MESENLGRIPSSFAGPFILAGKVQNALARQGNGLCGNFDNKRVAPDLPDAEYSTTS